MKILHFRRVATRCGLAFSLVETIIAIGVVSFAVLAILGLFHVAYSSSLESRRETRASFIAKQIFGDLRASAYSEGKVFYGPGGSVEQLHVNLATSGTFALACDLSTPLKVINASEYMLGDHDPEIGYMVRFSISTNTGFTNLSRVDLEVSAPPTAALTNRLSYSFVTLIWRNQ